MRRFVCRLGGGSHPHSRSSVEGHVDQHLHRDECLGAECVLCVWDGGVSTCVGEEKWVSMCAVVCGLEGHARIL